MMTGAKIADVAAPNSGVAGTGQRDVASSSAGSFGDTLKGQMDKAKGTTTPSQQAASANSRAKGSNDATGNAQHNDIKGNSKKDAATGMDSGDKSAKSGDSAAAKSGKKSKKSDSGDGSQVSAVAANSVTPPTPDTAAAAAADAVQTGDDPAAQSGKKLPAVAATTADTLVSASQETAQNELPAVDLPDWLSTVMGQKLTGASATVPSGQGTDGTDGLATGADGSASSQSPAAADNTLFKELQALAAAGTNAKGDTKTGDTVKDGDQAALFKLLASADPSQGGQSQTTATSAVANFANTIGTTTPATTTPSGTAAVPLTVDTPVGQQGWGQAVSERVVWLAQQGMQQATIQLHPKNMGPIEVHISLHKDNASVAFVAHHATTREALTTAMPKLRDMMQQSGLNLAQSDVSHQSFSQQGSYSNHSQNSGQGGVQGIDVDGAGVGALSGELHLPSGTALGVVDYYA